jgi:hypothetical protein
MSQVRLMAHAWLVSIRRKAAEKRAEPGLAELTVPEVYRLLEVAFTVCPPPGLCYNQRVTSSQKVREMK